MSGDRLRGYRFATEAQWNACLFATADRAFRGADGEIRPLAPYAESAPPCESAGARAPSIDRFGAVRWIDDSGRLHRLYAPDEPRESLAAPFLVANARRIVANRGGLWALGDGALHRYDPETLARLDAIEGLPDDVVDIASDGRDGLYLLLRQDGASARHLDGHGQPGDSRGFEGVSSPKAFVFLARSRRFVLLDERDRLRWFGAEGGAELAAHAVAGLRPCFDPGPLGSDARERVFLAGRDSDHFGGRAFVLLFDADANRVGEIALAEAATGIAARRDVLCVTTGAGLRRYSVVDTVPEDAAEMRCELLTPPLESGDRSDGRRWLRLDAATRLPPGATLEIHWAATNDEALRDRLRTIASNEAQPASRRLRRLVDDPDLEWRRAGVYHGSEGGSVATLSAPLLEARERFLWVRLVLIAAAGAKLPGVSRLAVLHPERSLMDELPAVYQRADIQPDSALRRPGTGNEGFLRSLVGILEATTQDLDERIAVLGRQIHPASAPEAWLDFVAGWLGLPWDEALTLEQKRCVMTHASQIAASRGTRAGLETLLACLFPGEPRRFRVTDATADFGFAIVGGDACDGSALPVMLGGRTCWSAELGSRSVLGHMRLPCDNLLEDGAWQLAGRVRVEVAASAGERAAAQPWLASVLGEMVPVTARLQLRWATQDALASHRLDGTMRLDAPPPPRLGSGAITGTARLPERGSRLSATGPGTGTRLH